MTKTEPAGWNRHTIKAAIGLRGLTMTAIAKDAGLESWQVRHGLRGNNRIGAEAIADALGIPFRTLFPDSYLNGTVNEADTTCKSAPSTRENRHGRADLARGMA